MACLTSRPQCLTVTLPCRYYKCLLMELHCRYRPNYSHNPVKELKRFSKCRHVDGVTFICGASVEKHNKAGALLNWTNNIYSSKLFKLKYFSRLSNGRELPDKSEKTLLRGNEHYFYFSCRRQKAFERVFGTLV